MRLSSGKAFLLFAGVRVLGALGWGIVDRLQEENASAGEAGQRPAPVEVVAVERGPIELRRTFSGSLESPARFTVAPKIGGRVERLTVDIADAVERGQVVAKLDDEEQVQAVAQAQRDLLASQIAEVEAMINLKLALIDLYRPEGTLLKRRGVDAPGASQHTGH